jgi:hypothetical protein
MSYHEVKTFDVTCDFCKITTRITTDNYYQSSYSGNVSLSNYLNSQGWERIEDVHHDCGLTGYSRTDYKDKCPKCVKILSGEYVYE